MKYLAFFLMCFLVFFNSYSQNNTGTLTTDDQKILWLNTYADVGKVKIFHTASADFKFVNTGKSPIIIYNAKGSCGCVKVIYPKRPVNPGDTAEISVLYTPAELGVFKKEAYIYTNLPVPYDEQTLKIKGKSVR